MEDTNQQLSSHQDDKTVLTIPVEVLPLPYPIVGAAAVEKEAPQNG